MNKPPIREILECKDKKERRRLTNKWFNEFMENRDRLAQQKNVPATDNEDFLMYYYDEMGALYADALESPY